MSPAVFRLLLNLYPPYLGTGIVVRSIASDFRAITVQMKLRWYNRNYVNTHFGGSLYAMTDPFYMLMLLRILGSDYIVWDKSAHIEFVKPGRGTLTAQFTLDNQQIEAILRHTAGGDKYFPEFITDITNEAGQSVARVTQVLYVRKKPAGNRQDA